MAANPTHTGGHRIAVQPNTTGAVASPAQDPPDDETQLLAAAGACAGDTHSDPSVMTAWRFCNALLSMYRDSPLER